MRNKKPKTQDVTIHSKKYWMLKPIPLLSLAKICPDKQIKKKALNEAVCEENESTSITVDLKL